MRKSLFKLQKNKQFNYTPRYYEGKTVENPFDFDSNLRRDRELTSYNDLRAQWREARDASRNRKNKSFNTRFIVITLILLLVFLYIIDFDLSIFRR
jgi:hypothetical protein